MRIIVPGNSIDECKRRVEVKKKEGWKPVSEVVMDTSGFEDVRWVCVMEKPDDPNKRKEKHRWNRRLPILYNE